VYVGGTRFDGKGGRKLDFLFRGGHADQAILIEIKTPMAKLLTKSKYRNSVYAPSTELAGSIVQVNDYLDQLRQHFRTLGFEKEPDTFNPKRGVLIGSEKELSDKRKRSSFELFRSSLSGIDVVTFDEFFSKAEHLLDLFNLAAASASTPGTADT
jgi:hypothetical protein